MLHAMETISLDATLAHFAGRLAVETDVADVAHALAEGEPGFVLVDARSRDAYRRGHLPGAVSLPHAEMSEETNLTPAETAAVRAYVMSVLGAG